MLRRACLHLGRRNNLKSTWKRSISDTEAYTLQYQWDKSTSVVPAYAQFKWLTVPEGEKLAVWGVDGSIKTFEGPTRKLLLRSHYKFLVKYQQRILNQQNLTYTKGSFCS